MLGPVLFLIYINDLDCAILSSILKFAVDTNLFSKIEVEKDSHMLHQDLSELFTWSHEQQMLFSVDKCKVMHVGKNNKRQKLHINACELATVEDEKDLGILFTTDLNHQVDFQLHTKEPVEHWE